MAMDKQVAQRQTAPGVLAPRKDLVRSVMAEYVRPIQQLRRFREFGDWLPQFDLPTKNPEDHHRQIAKERWHSLPDFPELLDAINAFGEGWEGTESDEALTRVMIGLMLDGLPSAKTLPSASYIDALVFILSDDEPDEITGCFNFQPLALAAAVAQIWKTSTFAPSPAEFLAVARKKRAEFYRASETANRLYDLRSQAELVLLTFGDIKPDLDSGDDIKF